LPRRNFGVVISASHNLYDDNGIKFFDAEGGKLSDEIEEQIEAELEIAPVTRSSVGLGRASRVDKSRRLYQDFCAESLPKGVTFEGLKLVVDCGNGAGYKVVPRTLADLGAEIIPIGCSPNGRNINDGCGSTAPSLLQLTVPGVRAAAGIALDGDGDRLVMVDGLGRVIDGDQIIYIIASARKRAGTLQGPVVGTVMSNLGLEVALRQQGIDFRRAQVGDRYVLAMLRETGGTLGGETSGHILLLDKTTTGDALMAALQVLAVMRETGQGLAELAAGMPRFPQTMINVRVARRFNPSSVPEVEETVQRVAQRLGEDGRVVLRPSGTEPVIRVMVEARDETDTVRCAEEIAAVVRRVAS
jgi:phosphoglucosamine mutase